MPTSHDRRVRIQMILNSVNVCSSSKTAVKKDLLFGEISNSFGTSYRTFEEYLDVLILTNKIVVVDNSIWTVEAFGDLNLDVNEVFNAKREVIDDGKKSTTKSK